MKGHDIYDTFPLWIWRQIRQTYWCFYFFFFVGVFFLYAYFVPVRPSIRLKTPIWSHKFRQLITSHVSSRGATYGRRAHYVAKVGLMLVTLGAIGAILYNSMRNLQDNFGKYEVRFKKWGEKNVAAVVTMELHSQRCTDSTLALHAKE